MAETQDYILRYTDQDGTPRAARKRLPFTKPDEFRNTAQAIADDLGVEASTVSIERASDKQQMVSWPTTETARAPKKTAYGKWSEEHPWMSMAAENLPYMALSAVNPGIGGAGFLASHPGLTRAALRTLMASPIGAGFSAAKGESPVEGAAWGAGSQLASEAFSPLIWGPYQRGGKWSVRREEDALADRLMKGIKQVVPWWKGLGEGHAGLHDVSLTGRGHQILSKEYGKAIANVVQHLPANHMTTLTVTEANALKLPIAQRVVRGEGLEDLANVLTDQLIPKLSGLWERNPELNRSVVSALDQSLPDLARPEFQAARRIYKEGITFANYLERSNAIDQTTRRLSYARFGAGGLGTVGDRPLLDTRYAPQVNELLRGELPAGKGIPRAGGWGKMYYYPISQHVGWHPPGDESVQALITGTEPKHAFRSYDVPPTWLEQEVRRWTPAALRGAVSTITEALGIHPIDPMMQPPQPAAEGATP